MKFPKITVKQLAYFSLVIQIVVFSIWTLTKIFLANSNFDYFESFLIFYFFYFFIALIVFSEDKNPKKFTAKNYMILALCLPLALPFLMFFGAIIYNISSHIVPLKRHSTESQYQLYKLENGQLLKIDKINLENGDFPKNGNIFDTDSLAITTATDTIKFKADEETPVIN